MKKMKVCNADNDFNRQVDCIYKDERYSARDNGAVLRHPHQGKRPRPTDNLWTFGKLNALTGYNEIASVRIHRIVATAFHGLPPTKEHVVDHIDTNKQNNRPENLRWVTRLENVLLNPITAKRITIVCGSVEAFLADPLKFREDFLEPNYKWMCNVSRQEAEISLKRMLAWAQSGKLPFGGPLGEWIFNRGIIQNVEIDDIIDAVTPNAVQRDWRTPSEFPCCPQEYSGEPLLAYGTELKAGLIFCRNNIYSSIVLKSAISDDRRSLYVMSESTDGKNAIKPWGLAKITFENNLFVHTSLHNFFTQEGAEKQYCLAQGLEWFGGDTVDDYC
ncbi:MAG: HNH endonuclease signature motif containing protein [Mucilaginibacter sp.]